VYISFEGVIQRLYSHKKCVLKLHNEWQETGSILDEKKRCPKYAVREQDIQLRLEMSPGILSHQLGRVCGILKSSFLRCLKAFRFHPYKVLVVQNVIPADAVVHIIFCH
jgi:hypothetical protein